MDYEKIIVVRDKVQKCSYFTLHDNRTVCITDHGNVKYDAVIPTIDPPNTPARDKRVFALLPYPYTGLEIPPRSVEEKILQLIQESSQED